MPPTTQEAPQPIAAPDHLHGEARALWIGGALALLVLLAGGAYYYRHPVVQPLVTETPKKIGIANFRQGESAVEGLKAGLSQLGYTNVTYVGQEVSVSDPNFMDTIKKEYAQEITQDHVDLLFADHEQQAVAALQATKELNVQTPIVYLARFHDPVQLGLAATYKSSGDNATGVAQNLVDTTSRNLRFIKEIAPNAKKIGVFGQGFVIPGVGDQYLAEFKKQAQAQGFTIVEYTTDAPPQGAEAAWHKISDSVKPGDIDALIHVPGHFFETQEVSEFDLARRLKIPHSVPVEDMPTGGDFSYAADFQSAGSQAAKLVDKIFRGTKPTDIPIEYGEKSILILNQVRADESKLKFPDTMVYLADKIITASSSPESTH